MTSSPSPSSPGPDKSAELLAKFPAEIREAHARYLANQNPDDADLVILAVVRSYLPTSDQSPADRELRDDARLIDDLGYDSLAIAELVFFLEDLYQVRVEQTELMNLSTVGQLRTFIRERIQREKR